MQSTLKKEIQFFNNYVDSFLIDKEKNLNENILLKKKHSIRVTRHALDIAKSLELTQKDIELSGIIGLFHDIGRFTQYRDYQTFSDKDSVYHGDLGIKVLKSIKKTEIFNASEWEIVETAIHNHGLPKIESDVEGKSLLFSQMIRDADKLDIFYLVDAYYQSILKGNRNIALELGLSHENKLTDKVFEAFMREEIILKSDMQYLNDFKLLQVAWIYDLNFPFTKTHVKNTAYLHSIIDQIDIPEKRSLIKAKAENYLNSTH